MEAAVLAGLVGIGYLFNNQNKENNPITPQVNNESVTPNGDNLYNSEFYNEADQMVTTLANRNFEASHEKGTNVINSQKLDRIGSNINQESTSTIQELKDDMEDYTYSNAAGGYLSVKEFQSDDRGIMVEPFFASAPANVNMDEPRRLNQTQGGNEFYESKRETSNFFPLEQQNIFGNQFGEGMGDPSRYNSPMNRSNELPFTQQRVQHIDSKSGLNSEIGKMIADSTNIDKLRAISNPKLSYKAKVLSGKEVNDQRGLEGKLFKHDPDTFYENTPERYFVTNGAYLEKSGRPKELLKGTNRAILNKQPIGNASPSTYEAHEERPFVRKPLKNQLGSDTVRNATMVAPLVSTDIQQASYRVLPNERDVTTLRNHVSNLTTDVGEHTLGIQDILKKTVKQTTLDPKNNGNIQNRDFEHTLGIMDNLKKTKKQTTINSKNNGNLVGDYKKRTAGYEVPETTTKDTIMYSYYGGGGGFMKEEMSDENYLNAETNPTKEIIAQGRYPVPEKTKLANGEDSINMEIKKIETDYFSHRQAGLDKVYDEIPTKKSYEITTMKDRLDDESIATRIDPKLLNPFRNNPYTQTLGSVAGY
jgi:hypothetical protein